MSSPLLNMLDHVAVLVGDTEVALQFWRDQLGLPVVASEVVNQGAIRLTHLDLGNTHLQLVEPLAAEHPLRKVLAERGPGLHHLCFRVDDVSQAQADLAPLGLTTLQAAPHQGVGGKRALFLSPTASQGIPLEITGR